MALPSTLYRFHIKLSDVDRGIYELLELRVARHPSEAPAYLLTRMIAYALNVQEGIELTQGIGAVDDPAIWVKDLMGTIKLWVDIGNPSARRLHKAAKASPLVRVYPYRDPEILLKEMSGQEIYRREEIEIYALSPLFLKQLETTLERDNAWELLHTDGELSIGTRKGTVQGDLRSLRLQP